MPYYDYMCEKCGKIEEKFSTMEDRNVKRYCPNCEQQSMIKMITLSNCVFKFKGTGFYATDYQKNRSN